MIPLIEQHRAEIESLCRRFGVKRLDVFGSAATGAFDPARSDVDFLVEFRRDTGIGPADQYFGMLFALEDLFRRRVDLVCEHAILNRHFRADANRHRRMLYAA